MYAVTAMRMRKSSRTAHAAMNEISSLNAYRANTVEPARSWCSDAPSTYVMTARTKKRPAARKTTGVIPSASCATTPSAK